MENHPEFQSDQQQIQDGLQRTGTTFMDASWRQHDSSNEVLGAEIPLNYQLWEACVLHASTHRYLIISVGLECWWRNK